MLANVSKSWFEAKEKENKVVVLCFHPAQNMKLGTFMT